MAYRTASVVDVLNRYLPFNASSGGLYEEYAPPASDAPPPYSNEALDFILEVLKSKKTRLVLLTGDAGHGKTHLSRRVLEEGAGLDAETARERLLAEDGSGSIELPRIGRRLRVVKDLSDFTERDGARLLADILADDDTVGLVCVNEGRLRAVVAELPDELSGVLTGLQLGIEQGVTEATVGVRIVNLNYQAAAPTRGGFLMHLVDSWLGDGRRWSACRNCDAVDSYPIFANQARLTSSSGAKDALLQIVRIAEQSGYVLTYRETLFLVSYLVTGGLTCGAVEAVHSRKKTDLDAYLLVDLLFERTLADAEAKNLRILRRLRTYDPGLLPLRTVDDSLVRSSSEGEVESGSDAHTKPQQKRAAQLLREGAYHTSSIVRQLTDLTQVAPIHRIRYLFR